MLAGTALTFWLLTGASAIPGRGAIASRYQLTSATLLILLAAELLREVRIGPSGLVVLSAGAGLLLTSNLLVMRSGYDFMRVESQTAEVDVGALELLGPAAPPGLSLAAPPAHDPYLTAGRYFADTRAHGAPPFRSSQQIASSASAMREAADTVLGTGSGIARPGLPKQSDRGCLRLAAGIAQSGGLRSRCRQTDRS